MTDFGRRGELPPAYIEDIEVSNMAVFVAAVRFLIERARSRVAQLPEAARQLIETIRKKLFTGRSPSIADYDAPRSEITAFLSSCRQIFWAMAAFSGLSNILMLTGSFFMLPGYDRVLPARSVPPLLALLALAIALYFRQAALAFLPSPIRPPLRPHLLEPTP